MKARGPFGWPKGTLPQALGGTGGTDAVSAWAALAQLASQAEARAGTDATKAVTSARLADRLPVSATQFLRLQQSATSGALQYTGNDGFKNLAGRNGGLEVWQRGTPVSVAASTTAYTVDGWALKTGANQASTVTQAARGGGSRYAALVQRNSGQTGTTAMNFEFPLDTDEIVPMQGKVVTLSMDLAAGVNWSPTSGNMTIELRTGTGSAAKRSAGAYTGDAAPISVTQSLTAGGAYTRYTFTSSAIGASVTQASIYLTWTPTGTAGVNDWFAIDDVQLEISPVATAFERRPFALEELACQRHLRVYSTDPLGLADTVSTLYGRGSIPFGVAMRTTPSLLSGATYTVNAGSAGTVALENATPRGTAWTNSAANWTVNAIVRISASLSAEI